MFEKQIESSIEILKQSNISLAKGMSKRELRIAEARFGITFPPDFREFLSVCLPVTTGHYNFTNWRDVGDQNVANVKWWMFNWTIQGVLYTIEKLGGWLPSWGNEPTMLEFKLELAKQQIRKHPLFIPICGNRFLSLNPKEAGNPVYSIHQGDDVICYGKDFWDYIEIDFKDDHDYHRVDLKTIKEPMPHYNEFVYHSLNNFFSAGKSHDEHGRCI